MKWNYRKLIDVERIIYHAKKIFYLIQVKEHFYFKIPLQIKNFVNY